MGHLWFAVEQLLWLVRMPAISPKERKGSGDLSWLGLSSRAYYL